MEIIFAALLAGKALLPVIDRESLDLQAHAEALRPRTEVSRPRGATSQPHAEAQRPATTASTTRVSSRSRNISLGPLDLTTMTTICREAGGHTNPVAYVTRLSAAYELNANQARSLRTNCAEYLRARAETLRNLRAQN
jgi:hypothetical protein